AELEIRELEQDLLHARPVELDLQLLIGAGPGDRDHHAVAEVGMPNPHAACDHELAGVGLRIRVVVVRRPALHFAPPTARARHPRRPPPVSPPPRGAPWARTRGGTLCAREPYRSRSAALVMVSLSIARVMPT